MSNVISKKKREEARAMFATALCLIFSECTGEKRPFPEKAEDEPQFWDIAAYPKTARLLRELVAEFC